MSTIEEEFFKCFGIKGEVNYTCPVDCGIEPPQMRFRCPDCEMNNTKTYIVYPQITDRILLELICILNKYTYSKIIGNSIIELKEDILKHFIQLADKDFIYLKVQKLFEVEE